MKDKKSESPIRKKLLLNEESLNQGKKSSKSLLRRKSKEHKKKNKKRKFVVFGMTFFLMIVFLLIYSLSFLLAPSYNLKAVIKTVRGGYELSYEICTVSTSSLPDNISIGDTVYMTETGTVSRTAKNALKMKVASIGVENSMLEFAISDVPNFISTSDMKSVVKNSSNGKIYSHIYISGKVIGGRFVLQKLYF